MEGMTVREYATREEITLGTAYRRIWERQVKAEQFLGRWLISPDEKNGADRSGDRVRTVDTQDLRNYTPA